MNTAGKIAAGEDTPWTTINGRKYPYSFKAPKGLKLSTSRMINMIYTQSLGKTDRRTKMYSSELMTYRVPML